MRTDKQEKLEAQRKEPIDKILKDALEARRGHRQIVGAVCIDLDISDGTLYRWCEDLEIDIDQYRTAKEPQVAGG